MEQQQQEQQQHQQWLAVAGSLTHTTETLPRERAKTKRKYTEPETSRSRNEGLIIFLMGKIGKCFPGAYYICCFYRDPRIFLYLPGCCFWTWCGVKHYASFRSEIFHFELDSHTDTNSLLIQCVRVVCFVENIHYIFTMRWCIWIGPIKWMELKQRTNTDPADDLCKKNHSIPKYTTNHSIRTKNNNKRLKNQKWVKTLMDCKCSVQIQFSTLSEESITLFSMSGNYLIHLPLNANETWRLTVSPVLAPLESCGWRWMTRNQQNCTKYSEIIRILARLFFLPITRN